MTAPTSRSTRYDPDQLAHLEEERDFLLTSLDDLDAEFEAGDVSESDYRELRDGYVARAADAIRQIEGIEEGRTTESTDAPTRSRGWLWVGLTVVFAAVAGVALAQNMGLRSGSETLTGTIADGANDNQNCITESFGDPAAGIACFDQVLESNPQDVEALTYRAWARVRADDSERGRSELDEVIASRPDYPDAYVFRAVVARDDGDLEAAGGYLDTLYSLDPAPSLLNTLRQMGLEREIAVGRLSEAAAACWAEEDEALSQLNAALTAAEADKDALGVSIQAVLDSDRCWNELLETSPDDVTALTLRAYGLLTLDLTIRGGERGPGSGPEIVALDEQVIGLVDAALALDAENPDALVLRAAMRFVGGDADGARTDLDSLGDARVSPLLSGVDAATIRDLVESEGQ